MKLLSIFIYYTVKNSKTKTVTVQIIFWKGGYLDWTSTYRNNMKFISIYTYYTVNNIKTKTVAGQIIIWNKGYLD